MMDLAIADDLLGAFMVKDIFSRAASIGFLILLQE